MSKISVIIITKDEEGNIGRCLDSVKWADQIIVVDTGSIDATKKIAEQAGAVVYDTEWDGFGRAKSFALSKANFDWVLSIDADEVATPELADEIIKIINEPTKYVGYFLKRKTMFLGRWILHCGWYPDYILRLFQKSAGQFSDAVVHEKVILDGQSGRLNHELLHYSYTSLKQYFEKMNRYTTLGAEKAYNQYKRAGWFDIVIRPVAAFFRHYISKRGFLDGLEGFVISVLSSLGVMIKYLKLRELEKDKEI